MTRYPDGMLGLFRELYDHMKWADAVVWRAAMANAAAEGDVTLRDRFIHIHMVQRAFLSIWRGDAPQFRDSFDTLSDIARWGREYHDEVRSHFDALDDAALDGTVILPWAATPEQLTAVGAALWRWCTRAAQDSGIYKFLDNQALADLIADSK